MTVVLANIALGIPFLAAFTAIPLWLTFRRPETGADRTEAHRYLRARAAHARTVQARTAQTQTAHATAA